MILNEKQSNRSRSYENDDFGPLTINLTKDKINSTKNQTRIIELTKNNVDIFDCSPGFHERYIL